MSEQVEKLRVAQLERNKVARRRRTRRGVRPTMPAAHDHRVFEASVVTFTGNV